MQELQLEKQTTQILLIVSENSPGKHANTQVLLPEAKNLGEMHVRQSLAVFPLHYLIFINYIINLVELVITV